MRGLFALVGRVGRLGASAPAVVLQTVAIQCYGRVMGTPISQRELRNESGAIMRRVEAGEHFTVNRNGIPVADLIPHDRTNAGRRRRFLPVCDIAAGLALLPDWEADRFADELRELDAAVDDSDGDRWADAP